MTDILSRLRGDIPHRLIEDHWTVDFEALDAEREEAADEIERLRASLHEEEVATEALQAKLKSESSCACSYDNPDDICMCHSPKLVAAVNEIERLQEAVKVQANAVKMIDSSWAKEINYHRERKNDYDIAIATLDSEREANKLLTAENERLRANLYQEEAATEALEEQVLGLQHIADRDEAEIARLRKIIDRQEVLDRLQKENNRLRGALQEIATEEYVDPKMTAEEALWYSKEVRAALEGK